jgi:hypothetical protein
MVACCEKQSAIRQNASVASSNGVRAKGHQAGLHGCVRGTWSELSADLDGFLRGLALWLNEGIETGRWGNGAEEAPHPTDSENLPLSEIMKETVIGGGWS